jgi:hypothetical protein
MTDAEQEARWRNEFATAGESEIRSRLSQRALMNDEKQRQVAYRWVREQERERERQTAQMLRYVRWTLIAAVAAVLVGIIGLFR